MMMESFTGTIDTTDESRRPPEGGHYSPRGGCGRLRAVVRDRPDISFRPRAASVGLERLRSLPRARARARLRPAVPDDGGAVGIRVLPVVLLSPVRRSSVDSAARAGVAECADAAAAVRPGQPVDRYANGHGG